MHTKFTEMTAVALAVMITAAAYSQSEVKVRVSERGGVRAIDINEIKETEGEIAGIGAEQR